MVYVNIYIYIYITFKGKFDIIPDGYMGINPTPFHKLAILPYNILLIDIDPIFFNYMTFFTLFS